MNASNNPEVKAETYSSVVERLDSIVSALESGNLSLEEALDRFSEGIGLVKRGEKMLADAEKRIEQLLSEDGATTSLNLSGPEQQASTAATPAKTIDPVKAPKS